MPRYTHDHRRRLAWGRAGDMARQPGHSRLSELSDFRRLDGSKILLRDGWAREKFYGFPSCWGLEASHSLQAAAQGLELEDRGPSDTSVSFHCG